MLLNDQMTETYLTNNLRDANVEKRSLQANMQKLPQYFYSF